jgi:DNA-binding XRE family transcriptional regulator
MATEIQATGSEGHDADDRELPTPLHDRVTARPGAGDRLASLREETLGEIGLFELRKALDLSRTDVAKGLAVSQAAVSQLERSNDLRPSTLRRYLARLGAHLELVAVFDDDGAERRVPFTIGDR